MREGHPVLWAMCDPRPDGLLVLDYPYFETVGTVFVEEQTYAGEGTVASTQTVIFNHGLGELFTALTDCGLSVVALEEHREVPWNPLDNMMIESADFRGEYVLASGPDRLPLTEYRAGRQADDVSSTGPHVASFDGVHCWKR